jgi:hypothetical protein
MKYECQQMQRLPEKSGEQTAALCFAWFFARARSRWLPRDMVSVFVGSWNWKVYRIDFEAKG